MVRAMASLDPVTSSSSRGAIACWSIAGFSRARRPRLTAASRRRPPRDRFPARGPWCARARACSHRPLRPPAMAARCRLQGADPVQRTLRARLLPTVLADAFAVGVSRADRALIERYLGKVQPRIRALPYGKWHLVYRRPRTRTAGSACSVPAISSARPTSSASSPARRGPSHIGWCSRVTSGRRTRRCCPRRVRPGGPTCWCWRVPTVIASTRSPRATAAHGCRRWSSTSCAMAVR